MSPGGLEEACAGIHHRIYEIVYLARGERFSRTPGRAYVTNAPRQGREEILQPLPGCVSLLSFTRGFASLTPG
jgi:hypothetical protein